MVDLWATTANQLGTLYGFVSVGDIRQFKTRVHAEGISYLTTTLPKLGKALEDSFQTGRLALPAEFRKRRGCAYSQFLHRAFAALFNEDGTVRYDTHLLEINPFVRSQVDELSSAVLVIRQLTLMFYKVELPYPQQVEEKFIDGFKTTDRSLRDSDQNLEHLSPLLTRASALVKRLLHRFDPMDISPRHGSGSSACGTTPWDRYGLPRYFPQVDSVYKYTEWYFSSLEAVGHYYPNLFEECESEVPTAKVVLIPKDSRGPRLISEEPRETMYLQQGLMAKLYEAIEYYPIVKRQLSCLNQDRNRALARFGSETGGYATLDLAEASDRVSLNLVRALFPSNWVECLEATRSPQTVLPSGEIFPLQKFAPMGSACCFPVECICFWAIVLAATLQNSGDLSRLFSRRHRDEVFQETGFSPSRNPLVDPLVTVSIFGDDIIVPTPFADKAAEALESVGLKVNRKKSYITGPFRESCGGDFYLGRDVAPVRVKHLLGTNNIWQDVCYSKFRLADFINNIVSKHHLDVGPYRKLFNEHYGWIDVVIRPGVDQQSAGLCLYGNDDEVRKVKYQPELNKLRRWCLIERGTHRKVVLGDRRHLLRWFLSRDPERTCAIEPVKNRLRYKMGWVDFR